MRPKDGFYFDGTKLVPIAQMSLKRKNSTAAPPEVQEEEKGQGAIFKNLNCFRNV